MVVFIPRNQFNSPQFSSFFCLHILIFQHNSQMFFQLQLFPLQFIAGEMHLGWSGGPPWHRDSPSGDSLVNAQKHHVVDTHFAISPWYPNNFLVKSQFVLVQFQLSPCFPAKSPCFPPKLTMCSQFNHHVFPAKSPFSQLNLAFFHIYPRFWPCFSMFFPWLSMVWAMVPLGETSLRSGHRLRGLRLRHGGATRLWPVGRDVQGARKHQIINLNIS